MILKLLLILIMVTNTGFAAQLSFYDSWVRGDRLPNADVVTLFHFDGNLDDASGVAWTMDKGYYSPMIAQEAGGKFNGALYDSAGISLDYWWMTANATDSINIGSGDYTFELWVNLNYLIEHGSILYFEAQLTGGTYRFCNIFGYESSGHKVGNNPTYSGDTLAMSPILGDKVWHHIVLERYNGVVSLYANGALQSSTSGLMATANLDNMQYLRMGRYSITGHIGNWLIDGVKLTRGAVYQGTVTEPTIDDYYYRGTNNLRFSAPAIDLNRAPDDDNIISLFNFDGNLDDAIDNNNEWSFFPTPNNTMIASDTGGKFYGGMIDYGSGAIGNGWMLYNAATASFEIGTDDWTAELWFYADTTNIMSTTQPVFDLGAMYGGDYYRFLQIVVTPTRWYPSAGYAYTDIVSSPAQHDYNQAWNHVVVERWDGKVSIWVNGLLQNWTTGASVGFDITGMDSIRIWRDHVPSGFAWRIDGLILTRGAKYQGNISIPAPTIDHYYHSSNRLSLSAEVTP